MQAPSHNTVIHEGDGLSFWILVLEKTWESLGQQGYQTSNAKGNQPWILIERTDADDEAPILWLPDPKIWFIGKDPETNERDWKQKEKSVAEDKIVGWHH